VRSSRSTAVPLFFVARPAAPAECGRSVRPNSGQPGDHLAQRSRSKTSVSVSSVATAALIVGSPVKAAMSPM